MAMKKRFYTMNSQMMAYDEGGVTKDFLTDHLGSITAEINQSQTRTYDARYSAYGRNNWSTGTGCGFGWVGSYGYRETGLFHMSHYVRARHYSYLTGAWSTVDQLWPDESAYGYVNGRATWGADPSGLLLTAKAGKCRVYKCYANRLLGHGCLVVEGPNLGCSSSRDPDSQYECGGAPGNRVDWDCRLISTDCEYGAKVCECVRLNKGGRPLLEYCKHGGCKQYITNLACCGCHRLPANKRGACEKKECAPAYWSEPPHRGGYGCGGGGGGLSLPKI